MLAAEYVGLYDPRANHRERQYHQLGLRSDLDIPSLLDGRLNYQHRVRLRTDFAPDLDMRPFEVSRSMVRIYPMQLGFQLGGWRGAVGRTLVGMPGASLPGAGLTDGVNVRTGVAEGVQVGAWAGAAPRINDIRPAGGALSFGVYSSMRRELRNRNRTRLALDSGLLGTTFDGALDRRAVSLRASVSETNRWLHGQVILDMGAPRVRSLSRPLRFSTLECVSAPEFEPRSGSIMYVHDEPPKHSMLCLRAIYPLRHSYRFEPARPCG